MGEIEEINDIENLPQKVFFKKGANEPGVERKHGPTAAFIGASWLALLLGVITYLIGLYNATMQLNEKGYYFTLLLYGLFSAVSLQKVVRDKDEGLPTTNLYFGICWIAMGSAILLMGLGLFNAGSLVRSEKGFYAMTYVLSLFASITVQKNVRDLQRDETK